MDKTKDVSNEGTRSFRGIHISCEKGQRWVVEHRLAS